MKTATKLILLATAMSASVVSCTGNSGKQVKTDIAKQETKVTDVNGVIQLNAPDTTRGSNVMKALKERKSVREYNDRALTLEDLSDLLWAANGINRLADGKRTAASAMNAQDIDIYVCLKEGAYFYDAKNNQLALVTKEDIRPAVADLQTFVNTVPTCLVLVSDTARFPKTDAQRTLIIGAMDAGIVSANISVFCSSVGLATVPRAFMNVEALKKALKLKESQIPMMNHPVGYFK